MTDSELAERLANVAKKNKQVEVENKIWVAVSIITVVIHSAVSLLMLKYGCSGDAMGVYILGAFAINVMLGGVWLLDKPETVKEAWHGFVAGAWVYGLISLYQLGAIIGIVLVIGVNTGLLQ